MGEDFAVGSPVVPKKALSDTVLTPFGGTTQEIGHNRTIGVDVPTLCFSRSDIEAHFSGLRWWLVQNIKTQSEYGVEHVYLVWRVLIVKKLFVLLQAVPSPHFVPCCGVLWCP